MGFLDWWNKNMPGAGAIGKAFTPPGVRTPQQYGFNPGLPGYQQGMDEIGGMQQQGGAYDKQYQDYVNGLRDMAQGRGQSLAENQYRQASGDAQQQIAAQAASGRGSPGLAQQQSMQAQAQVGQGLAAGSANARLQEQMASQQALGGAIQGADASKNARELALLQAKLGLSAEQAQNMLGYFQAIAGQQQERTKGDVIMGGIGALGGVFGQGG